MEDEKPKIVKKKIMDFKTVEKTNITETKIQVPTDVKRVQLRSTSNIRFGKNVNSAESALSSIHKKKKLHQKIK